MKIKLNQIDNVLVFGLAFIIFIFMIVIIETDIELHANMILYIKQGSNTYPANFLYYFLVNILTFGQNTLRSVLFSSVFVLSFAVLVKYIATKYFLFQNLEKENKTKIISLSISLLFVF